jgi:hypothetical protein
MTKKGEKTKRGHKKIKKRGKENTKVNKGKSHYKKLK